MLGLEPFHRSSSFPLQWFSVWFGIICIVVQVLKLFAQMKEEIFPALETLTSALTSASTNEGEKVSSKKCEEMISANLSIFVLSIHEVESCSMRRYRRNISWILLVFNRSVRRAGSEGSDVTRYRGDSMYSTAARPLHRLSWDTRATPVNATSQTVSSIQPNGNANCNGIDVFNKE